MRPFRKSMNRSRAKKIAAYAIIQKIGSHFSMSPPWKATEILNSPALYEFRVDLGGLFYQAAFALPIVSCNY